MEKKILSFRFQAPFYKVGSINEQTRKVWIIFHGYGQLADDFSDLFADLISDEHVLIFPQGLSKFYLKGVDKKIGANWMTSIDRELDIANYTAYLNQLFDHEIRPYLENIELNILGFSQGGHTASRWIYESNIAYHTLILWGSNLAYEIDQKIIASSFSEGNNLLVCGNRDRFIDPEQLQKLKIRYNQMGFKYQFIEYDGGHEIQPEILKMIVKEQ